MMRVSSMKLLFSLFFIFFSFLSLQTQARILIEYPINLNMDQFDWSAFSDSNNIQEHIDFKNTMFDALGARFTIISYLNIEKADLIKLEQELALYKRKIWKFICYCASLQIHLKKVFTI